MTQVVVVPSGTRVSVDAPSIVRLDENIVRHHTTHHHQLVCVECDKAVDGRHATRDSAGKVVCKNCE